MSCVNANSASKAPAAPAGAAVAVEENTKEQKKKFELKTPKGTKDFGPQEMALREAIFAKISSVFKRHGAVTIETPVFELKEVLTGKYGEDSKLIYDLQDQGGELCSLRYDLTVPFARFLAMNKQIRQMRRWQIAKVYRRDQPYMTKGRFREFYQCDFDVAGDQWERMLPDAEVVKVVSEILTDLGIGKFRIKLNNRKVLDGVFEVAGVPSDLFRAISSAVDKLDKLPWTEVRQEMLQKGISEAVADKIGEFVRLSGGQELVDQLLPMLQSNARAMEGLDKYLYLFGVPREQVTLDMSLARGLDYYTGMILEAVLLDGPEGVGSIAGGGRYDDLVGMFSSNGTKIPCVGASVGIERVFSILEAKYPQIRAVPTQILVAAAGADLMEERMQLCNELWRAGFRAEMVMKRKVKALDQFGYCEKNGVQYAVVIGPGEIEAGQVKLRNISDRSEEVVNRDELITRLSNLLNVRQEESLSSQLEKLKI